MEDLQNAIMDVPKALQASLGEWPLWIGFSALEYAGYWIQTTVQNTLPVEDLRMRNFIGAVTRGGLFSANIHYYNKAHYGA